jgi:predicted metalloprotease with PDZ domain
LCNTLPQGYSGLEHRDSTALSAPRDCFPSASRNGRSEAYRTFLGLASHEYFHAWNVKRIKPAAFTPYDLRQENYTGLLWLFEGFTSYYDDLLLLRAGLIDEAQYLELLGRTITTVWRTPGRHKQSLRDASFDAWIKYYRQDENSPNAIVSYYAKGALVALALDLTLRHQTRGRRSLDDVMRALWQRYGATGTGLAEDGLGPLLRDVTGVDCDEFFANFVDTPADPPLAELLGRAGVELRWRGAESSSDRGGRAGTSTRADLGLKLADGDTRVSHVYAGGAAEQAGLAAGDLLVAVDGLRVTGNNFDKLCGQLGAGDVIDIHLFRREELMQLQLTVQAPPETTCTLSLAASAKPAQRRRRAQWLHGGGGKEDRQ